MKTIITQEEIRELAQDIDNMENYAHELDCRMQEGLEEICFDRGHGYTTELFPLTNKKLDEIMDNTTAENYNDKINEIMWQALNLGVKIGFIHGMIDGANAHVELHRESEQYIDYLFDRLHEECGTI